MKRLPSLILALSAAAGGAPVSVLAQSGAPDVRAGATLASQGMPDKGVAACVTCHGAAGEGNAAADFPRIAGQPAGYLERQLHSYADGSREQPVMTPIAKGLDERQRRDVAAYYSSLGAPATGGGRAGGGASGGAGGGARVAATATPTAAGAPAAALPADQRRRAELLTTRGDDAIQVQGCVNCHGPGTSGEGPLYPALAGQHATYTSAALTAFRSGDRKNDTTGQMASIAKRLSESDIAALSAYFATLPPPVANDARYAETRAIRARAAAAAEVVSAPPGHGGNATPPTGTGIQQGAPMSGGNQGPGGGGGGSGSGPTGSPR